MISCPSVQKQVIRNHYDFTTLFYRVFWGRHIHHGLWEASENAREAQLNLTNTLAKYARIVERDRILDVGCGMGGSSIHLARTWNCDVTGVTISPFQRHWARYAGWFARVGSRTRFICHDAETVAFPDASFDKVWSVECTEHLFDKPAFFQRVDRWLKPGGRVAICAWLANDTLDSAQAKLIYDVCEGFFCPSLGSGDEYTEWFRQAGWVPEVRLDWSDRVMRTWEICLQRVRLPGVPWLARCFGSDMAMFIDRFETILEAYRTRAMRYGCLVARKP